MIDQEGLVRTVDVQTPAIGAQSAPNIDMALFSRDRLVALLLAYDWQRACEIVPNYIPPHPRAGEQPRCVICWTHPDGTKSYLRHSKGPLQGHGWDIYGDDYQNAELALLALSQAPPPPRVGAVIPNYGRPFRTVRSEATITEAGQGNGTNQ